MKDTAMNSDNEALNRKLYLDLMEKCIANTIYQDSPQDPWTGNQYKSQIRADGRDWPSVAHSMIGSQRLANVRMLSERVILDGVSGDLIETGAWRGGACILMRAVLKAFNEKERCVWCADSFEGLPKPDEEKYSQDKGDTHHTHAPLSISMGEVQANFGKYDLLDDQVKFLKGWFKDTLPAAPIDYLAILRLDGDMYQSTYEALEALYDKVSVGGYVIVDDYGAVLGCRQAVSDFLGKRNVRVTPFQIDWTGIYWRKA